MMLNHQCPICSAIHEKDCIPEPDLPCDACLVSDYNSFEIKIKGNSGNTKIDAIEEVNIWNDIKDLLVKYGLRDFKIEISC